MRKNIVSFNYENCFTKTDVLTYAKELNDRGFTIFILGRYGIIGEVINLCDDWSIKIDHDTILLLPEYMEKIHFLERNNFIFHVETDPLDLTGVDDIHFTCDIINYFDIDWKKQCEESIASRCLICEGRYYHQLDCPTQKLTIYN